MSDFLTRLAERQLGQMATVEPRLPELFAPMAAVRPLPRIEEMTSTVADGGRITPLSTLAAGVKPTPTPELLVFNRRQEGPETVVDLAQPSLVTKPNAASIPPRAVEGLGADPVPPPEPNLKPQPSRFEFFVTAPFEAKQPDSSREQPDSRVVAEVATRPAPPPLMSVHATPTEAGPPRLETKAPKGLGVAAREWESADAQPPIQVTIGRIEVTAVGTPPGAKRGPKPRRANPSLDDYLARRRRGER